MQKLSALALAARRAYAKRYREKPEVKERMREAQRNWQQKNIEHVREYHRKWRENNREKYAQYAAKHWENVAQRLAQEGGANT